jgi:hypothetical protein
MLLYSCTALTVKYRDATLQLNCTYITVHRCFSAAELQSALVPRIQRCFKERDFSYTDAQLQCHSAYEDWYHYTPILFRIYCRDVYWNGTPHTEMVHCHSTPHTEMVHCHGTPHTETVHCHGTPHTEMVHCNGTPHTAYHYSTVYCASQQILSWCR